MDEANFHSIVRLTGLPTIYLEESGSDTLAFGHYLTGLR